LWLRKVIQIGQNSFFFFFLVGLGFELRALCLLSIDGSSSLSGPRSSCLVSRLRNLDALHCFLLNAEKERECFGRGRCGTLSLRTRKFPSKWPCLDNQGLECKV
jgi:hypothetical protein